MALDFPASPSLNQVYTLGTKSWVWNGSGWEAQRPYGIYGVFNINTLSSAAGAGGGSATFNGTAYRFTLSHPPASAQQLIVSLNGVVQKPNTGTSQPAEGFAIDGADILFSDPPATSAPFFIVTIGTTVNIGEPSDNSVTSAKLSDNSVTSDKIVDGTIVDADINASAAIAGSKINPDFGSQNINTTGNISATSFNNGPIAGARNRIINGDMRIDQRNAGASVNNINGNVFSVDRFKLFGTAASKFSAQQSSVAPTGFTKSLLITSLSAYSLVAGDYFSLTQPIEGFNIDDLGFGTASASAVTLSFWVRSSLTGTFGGSLLNASVNRSYPYTYAINSANTWEKKTITIAGDATGTWATDNTTGIFINFGLGVGSNFSGTAGSWNANFNWSATGATSVVGTNGATFYITGVQLEAGTVATPFERRSYGQELALCQRYYYQRGFFYVNCLATTDGNARVTLPHPVSMRAAPTASAVMSIGNFDFSQVDTIQATFGAFGVGNGAYGAISSVKVTSEL